MLGVLVGQVVQVVVQDVCVPLVRRILEGSTTSSVHESVVPMASTQVSVEPRPCASRPHSTRANRIKRNVRALIGPSPPPVLWANSDRFTAPQVDDDVEVGIKASSYSTAVPPNTARMDFRRLLKRVCSSLGISQPPLSRP